VSQPLARPWTLDEFLAWERDQPERWEFDGVQPVPRGMVGGTRPHARLSARLLVALAARVAPPCEAFGPDLKVIARGRVRYPDALVECGRDDDDDGGDVATPAVVFEVLSPTTERTDRGTKAQDYIAEPCVLAIVLLAQDRPEATVLRRSAEWRPEVARGLSAVVALPEIGIDLPLAAIHPAAPGPA
jgi:Uma2 family endonuclease